MWATRKGAWWLWLAVLVSLFNWSAARPVLAAPIDEVEPNNTSGTAQVLASKGRSVLNTCRTTIKLSIHRIRFSTVI